MKATVRIFFANFITSIDSSPLLISSPTSFLFIFPLIYLPSFPPRPFLPSFYSSSRLFSSSHLSHPSPSIVLLLLLSSPTLFSFYFFYYNPRHYLSSFSPLSSPPYSFPSPSFFFLHIIQNQILIMYFTQKLTKPQYSDIILFSLLLFLLPLFLC